MKIEVVEMKLSVVMTVYNEREDWLRKAIESVLSQTYKDFEFIIVLDNPNNMDLYQIIEEYQQADSRIVFLVNKKNMGLIASLNRGLNIATGCYIARMDADDVCVCNRFETELRILEKESLDLVGTNVSFIDEDDNDLGIMNPYGETITKCRETLKYKSCLCHPTWMFRKELVSKFGDYGNIPTVEDYEFLCRMSANGCKMRLINEILYVVRRRKSSVTYSNIYYQFLVSEQVSKYYRLVMRKRSKYNLADIEQLVGSIDRCFK